MFTGFKVAFYMTGPSTIPEFTDGVERVICLFMFVRSEVILMAARTIWLIGREPVGTALAVCCMAGSTGKGTAMIGIIRRQMAVGRRRYPTISGMTTIALLCGDEMSRVFAGCR